MPDQKSKNEDGHATEPGGGAPEPKTGNRILDGRLDPDAQSPADERDKPFDPKENDPA